MDVLSDFFGTDLQSARKLFLTECDRLALQVRSYKHELLAPCGAPIYTDAVRIGSAEAVKVLVVVSGTHGVEGYAGSGGQVGYLRSLQLGQIEQQNLCVILIHMLNPWGAAWRRRHNEDNIDLNRHFINRSEASPENDAHETLVRSGFYEALRGANQSNVYDRIEAFKQRYGEHTYAKAIFQGQYDTPEGLGYGGSLPAWSSITLVNILRDLLKGPGCVGVIDIHTGLGPFGIGTIISTELAASGVTPILRSWYSEPFVELLSNQNSFPYRLQGDLATGFKETFPGAEVLGISLEFGTYEPHRFADLMLRDVWSKHMAFESPEVEALCCDLKHFFYPDSQQWRKMVSIRTKEVIQCALDGLLSRHLRTEGKML